MAKKLLLFITLILIGVCIVDIGGISAAEGDIYTDDRIPEMMAPYTEIKFISNNKYKIIKGDIAEYSEIKPVDSTPKPQ